MPSPFPVRTALSALLLLALSSLGFAAAWVLLAAWTGRGCSAMAVFAGLDMALMLRMARVRPGTRRAATAVLATAFTIFLACWGIAAARIGGPLGLMPWESLLRMGTEFGWLLVRLGTTAGDLAWFAAGLLAALLASR
jgi:hypothetical protein